jgi:NADH:ubiquinone oxidoreductase subunit E
MELIEMLRNIIVREGFVARRSLREVSEETGLPISEVLQREVDLHLIPAGEAVARLNQGPH